jgi:hypothetical protein
MTDVVEGFQTDVAATEAVVPTTYPAWNYRFRDIFRTYEPVLNKLSVLSKVYDATTIYKSRYFGYDADVALSRNYVAAQDKSYPLTTVLATGEPTVTTDTYTIDKVFGFLTNQLFVEGYRAIDLDPTTRNISAWPNFVPINLTQLSRPFSVGTGGSLPTLELDENFPFVRLDAKSSHAFTFTNTAVSPIHTIQFRIPTLNQGIPTPIMEYTTAATASTIAVIVNSAGNLTFNWGSGSYVSPYLIAANTWYSLYVALDTAQIKFSVSPFTSPTPFDKQDTIDLTEITGVLSMDAIIGRGISIDIYQALAYMGIYQSG